MKAFGVILVVLGIAALVWGGFTYTQRETVADLGPVEATVDQRERIPISPLVGGAALAAGIVILAVSRRSV
jgi:hypothetical protein